MMKKFFQSLLIKRILFDIDILFTIFLPGILTMMAFPVKVNEENEPIGPILFVAFMAWISCVFIGTRNTHPEEEDDQNFIPFINTLITLTPLNLLLVIKFFSLSDYYYTLPSIVVIPFFAIYITPIRNLIQKSRMDDESLSIVESSVINIFKIWKENPNATLSGKAGERILLFLDKIRESIETENQFKQLTQLFQNIMNTKVASKNKRPPFMKTLEMATDDEYVKLPTHNGINGGYFLKRDIVHYLVSLYKAQPYGSEAFTRARKNCPFYENNEMPYTTARGWVKKGNPIILSSINKHKPLDSHRNPMKMG